ncbi:MAG: S1 RNA-binding domain-containing protein [Gemella sp.]|nr:S1 RNA-binding domain-containing protein [Gemella sp.]
MELTKGQLVEAKVTKVDNQGLTLDINGVKAFLPKQNMHVGKKKKLSEIFSEGYNLSATVSSKKKDYYVLTQKEAEETAPKQEKKTEKKSADKNKKNKKKQAVDKEKINKKAKESKAAQKKEEPKEDEPKSVKLEDLKKLKTFGSMKISVQKKNSIKKLAEEKAKKEEEKKVLLDLPENFMENLTKSYEENSKKFDELVKRVREQGYLDED